jgi:LPXTG-site transpeptidase (sortase) family protein
VQEQNSFTPQNTPRPMPQRGQAGYMARQTSYFSSARPQMPVSDQIAPSLQEVSEAAQRLVMPGIPATPQPVAPTQPVHYEQPEPVSTPQTFSAPRPQTVSSFDFIETPIRRSQPVMQDVVEVEPVHLEPTRPEPQPSFRPAQSTFTPPVEERSLPTDLIEPVVVDEPQETPRKQGLKFPSLTAPRMIVGMATFLFIAGVGVAFVGLRTNKDVTAQVKSAATVSQNQDNEGGLGENGIPHEDGNPPDVQYYRTAASYPRVIRIKKTQVEARVLPLSIAPNGALKAPGNIFDAGWYKDSAKPGEPGATIIDGHASGPTRPGVFKNLGKLAKGDTIEIERGDGEKFTYTIQAVKVFDADKVDMSSVMVPFVAGRQGLNLITCSGKFDPATNKYEQRTVVYAVL